MGLGSTNALSVLGGGSGGTVEIGGVTYKPKLGPGKIDLKTRQISIVQNTSTEVRLLTSIVTDGTYDYGIETRVGSKIIKVNRVTNQVVATSVDIGYQIAFVAIYQGNLFVFPPSSASYSIKKLSCSNLSVQATSAAGTWYINHPDRVVFSGNYMVCHNVGRLNLSNLALNGAALVYGAVFQQDLRDPNIVWTAANTGSDPYYANIYRIDVNAWTHRHVWRSAADTGTFTINRFCTLSTGLLVIHNAVFYFIPFEILDQVITIYGYQSQPNMALPSELLRLTLPEIVGSTTSGAALEFMDFYTLSNNALLLMYNVSYSSGASSIPANSTVFFVCSHFGQFPMFEIGDVKMFITRASSTSNARCFMGRTIFNKEISCAIYSEYYNAHWYRTDLEYSDEIVGLIPAI